MVQKFSKGEMKVDIRRIPLGELKLDPQNVRFKHLEKILSDEEIEESIWSEQDTRDLMKSIRTAGGLYERPVISSDFIVKEGNRRIVCLRKLSKLSHEGKIPEKPLNIFDNVECEILPADAAPIEIDIYLALVHVKAKKPWRRLNQANKINDLYDDLGQSYDAICDRLGMGKRTIQVLNWAYSATLQYLQKYGDKADVRDFVYFDQLYKRRELREWIEADSKNLQKFGEWVASGKIEDPSRELKWLPSVLKNEEALEALEKDGLSKAKQVLQRRNPALASPTFSTLQKAIDVLNQMPRQEYLALREDGTRLDILKKLRDELEEVIHESES